MVDYNAGTVDKLRTAGSFRIVFGCGEKKRLAEPGAIQGKQNLRVNRAGLRNGCRERSGERARVEV